MMKKQSSLNSERGSTRRRAPLVRRKRGLVLALWLGVALACAGFWSYYSAENAVLATLIDRQVMDVTQLQRIQVARVFTPKTTSEVSDILKQTQGAVSIGGARASMGGQIAEPGSVHLDVRQMNQVVEFAPERREITVQAGMRWRDIQEVIDPHDLSIQIMQTYANFTVGGTLSVNAHGRYMGRGPVVQSVREIELVLANGDVEKASPKVNEDLFYSAIGGYGGIGVITQATLALDVNQKVQRSSRVMDVAEYVRFFQEEVRNDPRVIFHNADLRPPNFDDLRVVSWTETDAPLTVQERLIPREQKYSWTPRIINDLIDIPGGHWFRKWIVEPIAFSAAEVTYRNHEASYDIAELEPKDRADVTYVLREYFVPAERFDEFVSKMREVFHRNDVPVINISVRHASPDPGTKLAWTRGETFAFVVYYQQETTPQAMDEVGAWSREMIDEVLSVGGTYYLPYQNHATREQFQRAYPGAPEYFEIKRRVDSDLRFQNQLWYHYGPSPRAMREAQLEQHAYERKPEGQTLLTVPEWYLVFNPVEYVAHLKAGGAPDAFPFFESVREYWSLYKKVRAVADDVYPKNDEYLTMLHVIGVSTTVEYLLKGAYESTVGRLFRALASDEPNAEGALITDAFDAYAQLIYDEPWYEFEFVPWVRRIWSETPLGGKDVLRRTERKLAFSFEFLLKGAYATVLGWAAKGAYEPVSERIHVIARKAGQQASWDGALRGAVRHEGELDDEASLLSIERWKEFSEVVPALAERGVEFVEIAGNDDIAVSVVSDRVRPWRPSVGQLLFTSRLVTDDAKERGVWFVPVLHLGEFLRSARAANAAVEHLYDY
jgi:FAD/FMN-containing dehydrogenase